MYIEMNSNTKSNEVVYEFMSFIFINIINYDGEFEIFFPKKINICYNLVALK